MYIRLSDESDGWQTDGSCGERWEEPPDCEDLRCRESGYFTPNISSDSDVEEDMSYEDGRRAHTSMPTPPLSPKSPSATHSACNLHHEVLGKRLRDVIETQKDAVQAAVTISEKQWYAYANMLSPPRKPPRTSPNTFDSTFIFDSSHTPIVRPTCRFSLPEPTVSDCKPPLYPVIHNVMKPYEFQARSTFHNHMIPCLCIVCAGMKAKPRCTACLVCGESIPYSVCLKVNNGAHSHVPKMCFKCNCNAMAR